MSWALKLGRNGIGGGEERRMKENHLDNRKSREQ